jgi:hypothetical protein
VLVAPAPLPCPQAARSSAAQQAAASHPGPRRAQALARSILRKKALLVVLPSTLGAEPVSRVDVTPATYTYVSWCLMLSH